MSKQQTLENPLKETKSTAEKMAKAKALKMMAETFPGTEAEEMYLKMAEEALK